MSWRGARSPGSRGSASASRGAATFHPWGWAWAWGGSRLGGRALSPEALGAWEVCVHPACVPVHREYDISS